MRKLRSFDGSTTEATQEPAVVRSNLIYELAAATAFAALTALGARVQFHLPFTPVPVTGQVFCVLLAGGVLGARLGFVSQMEYLVAGAAGLPVFAHGGGPAALLGPTGGYLVGFPIAALIIGMVVNRLGVTGGWRPFLACLCGVVTIYVFGAPWYGIWLAMTGEVSALPRVVLQSIYPFMLVDAAKAAMAAGVLPVLRKRVGI